MSATSFYCRSNLTMGLKIWACVGVGLFLLGTAGCRRQTALERDYGQAWAHNQAAAIANPMAGRVETPAVGLNPHAGANVLEAYNKTFTGEKSGGGGSQTTINLGGLTTAGGGGK